MPSTTNFVTLTLKATLFDSNPLVWRRLLIPSKFNFFQLHLALQAAFGWENYHLFQFGKNGLADKDGIGIPNDDYPIRDAREIPLESIFSRRGERVVYVYDFGDHWKHLLELESISDKELHTAFCEDGANECPPEDVGSMTGYQEMIKVFASGTEAEKKEYRDWLGMPANRNWDPAHYDQREVNKRMALLTPENLTFYS